MYTSSQKFLNSKILFFKEFSSAHQACIYLIQSTSKNVYIYSAMMLNKVIKSDDKEMYNVTKDFFFR